MAITISGTNGIVGAGFTVDNSGVSVTAGVGTFGTLAAPAAGLTGALPAISAASLTSIPAANIVGLATAGFERSGGFGKILQVVATNVSATSSLSFTTAAAGVTTPATVTITSSAANSKFLVSGMISGEGSIDDYEIGFFLARVIGGSATAINVGTAEANRKAISQIKNQGYDSNNNASTTSSNTFAPYLDSPSQSASTAITYAIYVMGMNANGTFYVNRTVDNQDHAGHERPSSHITVMEVAA